MPTTVSISVLLKTQNFAVQRAETHSSGTLHERTGRGKDAANARSLSHILNCHQSATAPSLGTSAVHETEEDVFNLNDVQVLSLSTKTAVTHVLQCQEVLQMGLPPHKMQHMNEAQAFKFLFTIRG